MHNDDHWMQLALQCAAQARDADEVPVGAVIVLGDQLIASAHNRVRRDLDPTAHAEVLVLRAAAKKLANYRLSDLRLYCTLEPCAMCVGAMVHARIAELIIGAREPKTGACGSAFDLLSDPAHSHDVAVRFGVLAEQSSTLLRDFFARTRLAKPDNKPDTPPSTVTRVNHD